MLSGDRDEQQQKTAEYGFLIGNNVEYFSVFGPNWGFYRVGDDFIFYGSLMVIKTLRYFTRRFTVFYNLELPNSTMIGHVR